MEEDSTKYDYINFDFDSDHKYLFLVMENKTKIFEEGSMLYLKILDLTQKPEVNSPRSNIDPS